MSTIQGNYVVIRPVAKRFPPNPLLHDGTGNATAPVSETGSASTAVSKAAKALRYKLLRSDQRSIVTGIVSTQLQACQFINTIQYKKDDAQKQKLKEDVEFILTRQCFAGLREFTLDSAPNHCLCETDLHLDLESYGLWCLCPPYKQLEKIKTCLAVANLDWQKKIDNGDPKAPRQLDTSKDPFVVDALEVLVIYPQFLADNRPLAILPPEHRHFRNVSGTNPSQADATERSAYKPYYTDPHRYNLVDLSGVKLGTVDKPPYRRPGEELSIFAIIVNACDKVCSCRESLAPAVLFKSMLSEVVDEIFFVPTFHGENRTSLLAAMPQSQPLHQPQPGSYSNTGLSGNNATSVPFSAESTIDTTRDSQVRAPEPDVDPDEEGQSDGTEGDLDDDESDDFDNDPNHINGLTFDEMKTVMQRASDGNLSSEERTQNALLMLGLGRARPYPQFPPVVRT